MRVPNLRDTFCAIYHFGKNKIFFNKISENTFLTLIVLMSTGLKAEVKYFWATRILVIICLFITPMQSATLHHTRGK